MKSIIFSSLLVCALFSMIVVSAPSPNGKRLQLRVIKHQPCTSKYQSSERIRFPPLAKAPLVKDEHRGDGCYTMRGPVSVRKSIKGTVQAYVEVRSGIKAPLEKCTNADSNGCGGVGSCVYCDVCSEAKRLEKSTSGFVHIDSGSTKLDCNAGIDPGNYTDIKLSFCMPTKAEFLGAEGIDEEIWNENVGEGGRTFLLTTYLFARPVNRLSSSELQKIATDTSDQVIGCHKLIGSIYEASD